MRPAHVPRAKGFTAVEKMHQQRLIDQRPSSSPLRAALRSCRGTFVGIGLFSGLINVLMLTGSFFMLLVYDRVLPSRSIPTLVVLAILALGLFAAQGVLDLIRSRLLVRIGASLHEALGGRVYTAIVRSQLRVDSKEGNQPLRDLDSIRSFLSGGGPIALFDLPWMPLYLAIIFAFHPLLGWTAVAGAVVLVILTLMTEVFIHSPASDATGNGMVRDGLTEASRSNAEVLTALGMTNWMQQRWNVANSSYMTSQQRVSDVSGGLGAIAKVLRMVLQSAVLAIGAYLVIRQEASAGIIIAASILSTRALAPVDLAIANWRSFVTARQAWHRLNKLLTVFPDVSQPMQLPAPQTRLSLEHVAAVAPGDSKLVLKDISFNLRSGQGLGIIGPSASGKTSLARILVGVWQPVRGKVKLDGASLDQWSSEDLGRHVGYLPQDVELFAGTVAENISRFDPAAKPDDILAAATEAGVHELILNLRDGYETQLGAHGAMLSAGQQQRIALARALYRRPFLVVLDEPNSNLDTDGEAALTKAILSVRARGGIIIVIAHRSTALAGVDQILVMHQGLATLGAKNEILEKLARPAAAISPIDGTTPVRAVTP